MIKAIAISIVAGLTMGFLGGSIATFEFYRVRSLKAEIKAIKLDRARYRAAIGFSQGLEKEDAEVEISNDEIIRAILAKAKKPTEGNSEGEPVAAQPSVPAARACADAGGVLELGKLR